MLGIRKSNLGLFILLFCFVFVSCQAIRTTYDVTEETVKTTYKLSKFIAKSAYVAGVLIYYVGGFTFKVTNLENRRSIILRVNDRGPFVDGRIIDLSAGAARKLGFYDKGTAKVRVETIPVEG